MAAAESANIAGEGGPMCRVGTKPNRLPSSLLFAAGGEESMQMPVGGNAVIVAVTNKNIRGVCFVKQYPL